MRTTSSLTENTMKWKQPLNFAQVSAGGLIQIHQSMKTIQTSFLELDLPYLLLPHSRDPSKRRKSSRIPLIPGLLMISMRQRTQVSRLCTERANPLLHRSSSTKILVERWYSSVLLIWCLHSMYILAVRLLRVPLPIGFRTCWVGFIALIRPSAISANTGNHGVVRNSLSISDFCIRNCKM